MPGYDNELAAIVNELNRTATGTRPIAAEVPPPNAGSLDQFLRTRGFSERVRSPGDCREHRRLCALMAS